MPFRRFIFTTALCLSATIVAGETCPSNKAVIGDVAANSIMTVTDVAYEAVYFCYQFDPVTRQSGPQFRVPSGGFLDLPFEGQFAHLASVPGFQCLTPNVIRLYRGVMQNGEQVVAWISSTGGMPGVDAGSMFVSDFFADAGGKLSAGEETVNWLSDEYQWKLEVGTSLYDEEYLAELVGPQHRVRPLGPLGRKVSVVGCVE